MTVSISNPFPQLQVRRVTQNLDYLRVPLNASERADKQGDVPYWGSNGVVDHVNVPLVNEHVVLIGEDGAPFLDPLKPVAFAVKGPIWPNNHIHVLRVMPEANPRFIAYALNSVDYSLHIKGSTRDKLNQSELSSIEIPVPDTSTQQKIADHLDHETAEIDTLSRDLVHLKDLTGEKHEASRESILGLLSSELQWTRLKFLSQVTVGIVVNPSSWYVDTGVPALRGMNVKPEILDLSDLVNISDQGHAMHRKSALSAGDVVIVRTGQAGAAAMIPRSLDGSNAIDLLIAKPGPNLSGDYLAAYINSSPAREQFQSGMVGAIQGHFNVEDLKNLNIPSMSLGEQARRAKSWAAASEKTRTLRTAIDSAIRLTRERRAALITAAVTGQIDVTTKAKPAAEQLEDDIAQGLHREN